MICYMVNLRALPFDELQALAKAVASEMRTRQAPTRKCARCEAQFVGRSDARFCSAKCRVATYRQTRRKEAYVSELKISGVGYEGMTVEALVSRLRIRGIKVLVDVRLNAISRKRGFSKRALEAAMGDAGIEYVHLPQLGNLRENRSGYGELVTDAAVTSRDTFRSHLTSEPAVDALEQLMEISSRSSTAVFCFEADERHCHREQVLEALRAKSPVAV